MTSKEKAIELVDWFYDYVNCWGNDGNADYSLAKENARQCALRAVDEIMKMGWNLPHYGNQEGYNYWYLVKQEIEKL
jgi:hypothetical protein